MPAGQREILVGKVIAPFGVRGEVKIMVMTDFPERFSAGRAINIRLADGRSRTLTLERSRTHKDGLVCKLAGIDDRGAAEEIRQADVIIREDELTRLPEGRFYVFDILGLKVRTDDGRDLGEIVEVLQGGANDVYVTGSGLCIPALKDVVLNIDVSGKEMVIRPVPGLLPD